MSASQTSMYAEISRRSHEALGFDSDALGWSPTFCICNKLSSAASACSQTTSRVWASGPRLQSWFSYLPHMKASNVLVTLESPGKEIAISLPRGPGVLRRVSRVVGFGWFISLFLAHPWIRVISPRPRPPRGLPGFSRLQPIESDLWLLFFSWLFYFPEKHLGCD